MKKRTFRIVAIIAAVALIGTWSLTVTARDGDSDEQAGGILRHLHAMGRHLHGGGHHQNPMAGLIEDLELNQDQLKRVEKIHEIMGSFGHREPGSMVELHNRLIAQLEDGQIDAAEIHQVIDDHVEQIRAMAYGVTDELTALVNELDAGQRETLMDHVQQLHGTGGDEEGHGR